MISKLKFYLIPIGILISLLCFLWPNFALAGEEPDWTISYGWDNFEVNEGGSYDFSLNTIGHGRYQWPGGVAYGDIYKGELNNAIIINGAFLGESGDNTEKNSWPDYGNYFVVIYDTANLSGDDISRIRSWFQNEEAYPPSHWGIINFEVIKEGVPLYTQVLSDYPSLGQTDTWNGLPYAYATLEDKYDCGWTIADCGCTITSMIMLGRYYDIEVAVDNSDVDPGNINTWLTSNNGYTFGGNLWWGKAIEYLGSIENNVKKTRLSFDYYNEPSTSSRIDNYLTSAKPIIAKSKKFAHYFIIDDKDNNVYKVKDPLWYNTETLDDVKDIVNHVQDYDNYFDTANLFSFLEEPEPIAASIYLYLASPAELLVTDPLGRRLGRDPLSGIDYDEITDAGYTEEGPILSSDTPIDPDEIHEGRIIYIHSPINGNYDIKVIGTDSGAYTLDFLIYDDAGESFVASFEKITAPDVVSDYSLNYSTDPEEPVEIEEGITLDDTIEDVKISYDLGWITKKWVEALLIAKLRIAKRLEQKGRIRLERAVLKLFIGEVKFFHKRGHINDQTKELLINDTQYIIEHL